MPTSRPLSPHLQIYRWTYTMVLSVAHRATGLVLAAGAFLAVIWLVALMRGPESYDWVVRALRSAPGLLLVGGFVRRLRMFVGHGRGSLERACG